MTHPKKPGTNLFSNDCGSSTHTHPPPTSSSSSHKTNNEHGSLHHDDSLVFVMMTMMMQTQSISETQSIYEKHSNNTLYPTNQLS
jgi:hypothetical protein